jgi:hypothetical protein
MKQVHVTLQGKGGVGKSFVSSLLAQYHRENGVPAVCIDTDPVNATFSGYVALAPRRLELLEGSRVNERRFDELMEALLTEDATFVVDNGAASFIPFSSYLVENQAPEMIAGAGKELVVHTVVTGGQALYDTLTGFHALATQLPRGTRLIVWLNEFFGAIEADGKNFEQMRAYHEHRDRVRGVVRIARQTSDTFGKDVETMLDRRLTFGEVAQSPDFSLMAKQRLAMVRRQIFQQLDAVL